MRTNPVLVAIALELSAALAAAQTCAGTASFSSGRVRLSAGLATANNNKAYGVGMAVGRTAGPLAAVNLSRLEYEGYEGAGTGVGAGVDTQSISTPRRPSSFAQVQVSDIKPDPITSLKLPQYTRRVAA